MDDPALLDSREIITAQRFLNSRLAPPFSMDRERRVNARRDIARLHALIFAFAG
jgi:hypothetical protein